MKYALNFYTYNIYFTENVVYAIQKDIVIQFMPYNNIRGPIVYMLCVYFYIFLW